MTTVDKLALLVATWRKAATICAGIAQISADTMNECANELQPILAELQQVPLIHGQSELDQHDEAMRQKFTTELQQAQERLTEEQALKLAFELRDKDLLRSYANDIPDVTVRQWANRIMKALSAPTWPNNGIESFPDGEEPPSCRFCGEELNENNICTQCGKLSAPTPAERQDIGAYDEWSTGRTTTPAEQEPSDNPHNNG